MIFNSHEEISASELRERLGWWEHSVTVNDMSELVAAMMLLCSRVVALEQEVAKLRKASAANIHAANVASCLANGILPD